MPFHKVSSIWYLVSGIRNTKYLPCRQAGKILNTKYNKSKGFTLIELLVACHPKPWRRKAILGFTLIELLVAMTIISLLTGLGTFAFNNALDKGRDSRRKSDLSAVKSALTLYYQDNDSYPPKDPLAGEVFASDSAADPWIPDLVPTYIKQLPKDPSQAASQIISRLAGLIPKISFPNFSRQSSPQKTVAQNQPQVLGSIILPPISAEMDGYLQSGATNRCYDNPTTALVVGYYSSYKYRSYYRFSLSSLPVGATVTEAKLQINVLAKLGGGADIDIRAYGLNGQTDPELDTNCATKITNTAGGALYIDNDTTTFSATGPKEFILPSSSSAYSDIQNANSAARKFSITINEDNSINGNASTLDSIKYAGTNEAKLIITYTTAAPPIVTTGSATPITQTTATLNGTINPNGTDTTAWFRYYNSDPISCSDSGGTRSPDSPTLSGSSPVTHQYTATGLTANTDYWFCAFASNSGGFTAGSPVQPFKTSAYTPPTCSPTTSSIRPSESVSFSATGGDGSYNWSVLPTTGVTPPSGSSTPFAVTFSAEGNYTVTVTSAFLSDSCTVEVKTLVVVSACADKKVYCYVVSADRLNYILWAKLDNTRDPEIDNCSDVPNPPPGFNYCLKSE